MKPVRALFSAVVAVALSWGQPARAADPVYANDFEAAAGKAWSADQLDVTPKGNRRFLGAFSTERVSLRLEKLPKHARLRVSFDLYVIGTWDGNAAAGRNGVAVGPDVWRMSVGDPGQVDAHEAEGAVVLETTFSNFDQPGDPVVKEAQAQRWPAVLPGDSHPARTGAAERNTLGYQWDGGNGVARDLDSVYRISVVVPHTADAVRFDFAGAGGMATGDDETWGLDNVKVEALGERDGPKLGEVELRRLWETVGGRDPVAEAEAVRRLIEGGDATVPFLRARVGPVGVDKKRFEQWVAQLDGDDFGARERATEAIRSLGPAAEGLLREAADRAESAEVKLRLESALRKLAQAPPSDAEMRRHAVAVGILRTIGTPGAVKAAVELSGK
jgi:hypothetical protein